MAKRNLLEELKNALNDVKIYEQEYLALKTIIVTVKNVHFSQKIRYEATSLLYKK